ncbi:hypothetical protein ACH5RR_024953 [Cinchona calisaya]|uniref:Uncharacterized protein n=1 Tax=Cinchona calisaya TaxID=153742 RepID=A0ABD2YZ06_9GENT
MASTPERGKKEKEKEKCSVPSPRTLHNFTLPSHLKWGSQKHLRCAKNNKGSTTKSAPITSSASAGGGSSSTTTTEVEAVREKLVSDLKVAEEEEEEEKEEKLPWTLRNRRGVSRNANYLESAFNTGNLLPNMAGGDSTSAEQQRPKFSLTLSKEEIETDFLLMTGAKPPRRPKKRTRALQKQVDGLFPGAWLSEVTPGNYKVPDVQESKSEK